MKARRPLCPELTPQLPALWLWLQVAAIYDEAMQLGERMYSRRLDNSENKI